MGMDMGMSSYFVSTVQLKNLLFKGLNIKDVSGLVAACLVVFLATALFESLKLVKMYIELKIKQNPLSYGLMDPTTDRTQLLAPMNAKRIASIRLKFHFLGCMMHMTYLFCAYIIMLIFMTYSIWLGISIVIGSGAGHFVFGAVGHRLTKRYTKMASAAALSASSDTSGSMVNHATSGDPCHM